MKTGTRGLRPQSKESWGPRELEEARKDPPCGASGGRVAPGHLDSGPRASRTQRESMFAVLSAPVFTHGSRRRADLGSGPGLDNDSV